MDADSRRFDLGKQPAAGVHVDDDFVHKRQGFWWLVDDEVWSLSDDFEVVVGEQGGDLDDHVFGGVEACHFEIDPSEHDRILRTVLRSPGA